MLDTSYLVIKRAYLASSPAHDLSFSLPAKRHPTLGSALTIQLGKAYAKGDTIQLVVEYATTDESTALGWLEKGQTDSGKYPFVYAQCQVRFHVRTQRAVDSSERADRPSLPHSDRPSTPARSSPAKTPQASKPPTPPPSTLPSPSSSPPCASPRRTTPPAPPHRRHRPHDDVGAEERHPELPHWDRRRRARLQVVGKAHGRVGPAGRD